MNVTKKVLNDVKEMLDKATFHNENESRFFSITADEFTNFKKKKGIDFLELWDTISEEDKTELLTPYFK